ncbi:3420_t:CDS:2, partial [Scutellospora calospora]
VPIEDFDENWWLLVTNMWMQWNIYKYVNSDICKVFACYFTKHQSSSTWQKENLVSLQIVKIEHYKNSPNHSHSLEENEAVKNYLPSVITAAVKEFAMIKLVEAHLIGNSNLKVNLSNAISFLIKQGYQVEHFCILQKKTKGSYLFVSTKDSDTIEKALKIIRNKFCYWFPRYILFDQSSIEAKGVKKAFSGVNASEQEYELILCVVYIMRTWLSKIYERSYVTSTNLLESYHSELKRATSSFHGLIGVAYNIVAFDNKKWSNSEFVAFDFQIKKISAYGVENDILIEIHKFPYLFQQLLVKEACAVMNRIEKESGFEVYEGRELVIVELVQTEQQRKTKNLKLTMNELNERVCNKYWNTVSSRDIERAEVFISIRVGRRTSFIANIVNEVFNGTS